MAALLRSARSLNFSPSGLLQISRVRRSGPPLSRLYSGALGGRRTGALPRHITSSAVNVRSVWPCAVGGVRNYAVAKEQKEESWTKQGSQFEWVLNKLENSVKRTGRITKAYLLSVFDDICNSGPPSANKALLLLRSCGSLLAEMAPEERTELVHTVWDKLQSLGAQYDVSHYNALLKVYLQNEHKFSPTEFLAKMEAANIVPNRVSYQRLITAYCLDGDLSGASTILGFMKSKDLPITEAVFNSLVTGHSRAGDLEGAKNILTVMTGAKIQPGPDTYLSLLDAYAVRGDMESLKATLEEAEKADCFFMDRDILHVIFTLAKAGHQQYIPEMVARLKQDRGFVPEAMNLCLSLITIGQEDMAFLLLKSFPAVQSDNTIAENQEVGRFFLRHCVNKDISAEKLGTYCKYLQESSRNPTAARFTLFCALESRKKDLALVLMKVMKEQDLPIRPHFFWPLMVQHVRDGNKTAIIEILKDMKKLDVSPDNDTLISYVIPVFANSRETTEALKEAGIAFDNESYLFSSIRTTASENLAKLYNMVSDPLFPVPDLSFFRSSLITGFKKSNDVDSMVKITDLLQKDKRFCKDIDYSENTVSYFLFNLINSMTAEQLRDQEEKMQKYFQELRNKNIFIPLSFFKGIRNILQSNNCPELINDAFALVNPKEVGLNDTPSDHARVSQLEQKMLFLKESGKPHDSLLRQTILAHCAEENLERALELKKECEDMMTRGAYASLINLCCRQNNVEEALNLKKEMEQKDPSACLDVNKYLSLIRTLCANGRVEEAVDLMKEMKEKIDDIVINDSQLSTIFFLLAGINDAAAIRQLHNTMFSLGLVKPSSNLLSPLVTVHLQNNDLAGALDATLECQKLYRRMPRLHDVITALVEKGDSETLQKAMDSVSKERGEMAMMYDLFFAFLETGRYREARKIIETPGLRAQNVRLQWYAEKCISQNKSEILEEMVDLTTKLYECDRDDMYSFFLRLCKQNNDWQKAEATWTKMQEENIIPRERTLHLLADILKSNGQEVPFEVPELWYEDDANSKQVNSEAATPPNPTTDTKTTTTTPIPEENAVVHFHNHVIDLCKNGKEKEAFEQLKEYIASGKKLRRYTFDYLLQTLLSKGFLEEAIAVKNIAENNVPNYKASGKSESMLLITYSIKSQTGDALEVFRSELQDGRIPSRMAIKRLVQALVRAGDVEGIHEVNSLIGSSNKNVKLPHMLFANSVALAHINNGDLDAAVEWLEALFTGGESDIQHNITSVFKQVLESGDEKTIDKFSVMAERLANQFASYRAVTDLFLQLLDMDKVEDAKFMLARCNAVAEQKTQLHAYIGLKSKVPGEMSKIQTLLSLIPDLDEKSELYPHLIKGYVVNNDLPSAKALYEKLQEEGVDIEELTLKRLAQFYISSGETPPFPEPPESFHFYTEKLKNKAAKAQAAAEEE